MSPEGEPPMQRRITRSAKRRIRLALALVLCGLLVQLLTSLHWTPLTFVLSTITGIGPILLGSALFLWVVWRSVEPEVEP
jgi:membrane-anchored glycerophosphoryl diester phosphodiesterase (GDPDase)